MTLFGLIVALMVVGFLLWLIPMNNTVKTALAVIVVVAALVIFLQITGLMGSIRSLRLR